MRIINPLGVALHHYTSALSSLLKTCGHDTTLTTLSEPRHTGESRLSFAIKYRARLTTPSRELALVTWPALGYADPALSSVMGRNDFFVFHDPEPIDRASGLHSSTAARTLARLSRKRTICHSVVASQVLRQRGFLPVNLPMPMSSTAGIEEIGDEPSVVRPLRVIGQYKTSRNLELLVQLGAHPGLKGIRKEILGRGWPEVPGWSVRSEHVSERSFERAIASAGAVVIPYHRYYQSEIALRALSHAVPAVGVDGSYVSEIFGANYQGTFDSASANDAVRAVRQALELPRASLMELSNAYRKDAVWRWTEWLAANV